MVNSFRYRHLLAQQGIPSGDSEPAGTKICRHSYYRNHMTKVWYSQWIFRLMKTPIFLELFITKHIAACHLLCLKMLCLIFLMIIFALWHHCRISRWLCIYLQRTCHMPAMPTFAAYRCVAYGPCGLTLSKMYITTLGSANYSAISYHLFPPPAEQCRKYHYYICPFRVIVSSDSEETWVANVWRLSAQQWDTEWMSHRWPCRWLAVEIQDPKEMGS